MKKLIVIDRLSKEHDYTVSYEIDKHGNHIVMLYYSDHELWKNRKSKIVTIKEGIDLMFSINFENGINLKNCPYFTKTYLEIIFLVLDKMNNNKNIKKSFKNKNYKFLPA